MRKNKLLVSVLSLFIAIELVFTNTAFAKPATNYGVDAKVIAAVPAYSGTSFTVLNNNIPLFSAADLKRTDAFEVYSELDSLGRCGVAYANVCKEIMPTEKRGEIGQVRPSGWQTVKYPGIISDLYLYNRCHLIGYQLAGENANTKNLITGTRYMNVDGMLPFENLVDDYVEKTGNHVLYRVTPFFVGNNLVASGVAIEAFSVEDSGKGVCFNVYCYNVQPGIVIDYATGNSAIDPNFNKTTPISPAQNIKQPSPSTAPSNAATSTYVLNTNTKKAHRPDCGSAARISQKNKQSANATPAQLQAQGYSACQNCHPW